MSSIVMLLQVLGPLLVTVRVSVMSWLLVVVIPVAPLMFWFTCMSAALGTVSFWVSVLGLGPFSFWSTLISDAVVVSGSVCVPVELVCR